MEYFRMCNLLFQSNLQQLTFNSTSQHSPIELVWLLHEVNDIMLHRPHPLVIDDYVDLYTKCKLWSDEL